MEDKNKKILIVEDEAISALSIGEDLKNLGYTVLGMVGSSDEAFDVVAKEKPDIILMDINIKGKLNGIETAERITKTSDCKIVFLTGYATADIRDIVTKMGVLGYLEKPVITQEIVEILKKA